MIENDSNKTLELVKKAAKDAIVNAELDRLLPELVEGSRLKPITADGVLEIVANRCAKALERMDSRSKID
jgi:hypothetical protein